MERIDGIRQINNGGKMEQDTAQRFDAIREDINGLGTRISVFQNEVGKHEERLNRTRDDIKEAWAAIDKIRDDVRRIEGKIQGVELNLSNQIKEMETVVATKVGELRTDFERTASKLATKIAGVVGGISVAGVVGAAIVQNFIK